MRNQWLFRFYVWSDLMRVAIWEKESYSSTSRPKPMDIEVEQKRRVS
jgi:hypothetical protein